MDTEVKPAKAKGLRGDIQGLRAVAVGLVLLAHAGIPGFSGGFIGVDVFFVISGFLITGLLIGDVAKAGRVRFGNFYARRAARILPAATMVIVATAVGSAALLGVLQARSEMTDSLWAVLFAANIHFAQVGTNYFASGTPISPLMHYWSLAVEEQFYLVWPGLIALIALITRAKRRGVVPRGWLAGVLGVIVAGSMYWSITQTASNPTAAYFSTFTRTWELGLGALAAVSIPVLIKMGKKTAAAVSWLGLGAIVMSVVLFNASTAIPGWRALLPVLGSLGVLVGGIPGVGFGAGKLLGVRPARFVGDISYSLYLWHFPMLILGAAWLGAKDTLVARVGLLGVAVVVSALSYHGLENPLRHAKVFASKIHRAFWLWPGAVGLVAATVGVVTPSVAFGASGGPVSQMSAVTAVAQAVAQAQAGDAVPAKTDPGLLAAPQAHVNLGACDAYNSTNWRLCNYGASNGTKTVVIFGNSHASMWVPAVAVAAKAADWKFYPVVHEACALEIFPDLGNKWGHNNLCTKWYNQAKIDIARLHPDEIIFGTYTGSPQWAKGEATDISQLKGLTKKMVVLSDTTSIPQPAGCLLAPGATQKSCLWPVLASRAENTTTAARIAHSQGAQFINVTPWFCDDNLCPSVIDGIIPFFDGAHLTPEYSSFLGGAMGAALNLNGASVVQPVSVAVPSDAGATTTTSTTLAGG